MAIFLNIGLIATLIAIIKEDFEQRAIHVAWLIGFICFTLSIHVLNTPLEFVLSYFTINISFLVFQLLCLFVYFSVKNKKWTNIIDTYLGKGDVVFLFGLAAFLPPISFIWFYTVSLGIVLLLFVLSQICFQKRYSSIPLAGGLALCLLLWHVIQLLIP